MSNKTTTFSGATAPPPTYPVPSKSTPGAKRIVTVDENDLLICDCPRFQFQHCCSHVKQVVELIRFQKDEPALWNCRCGEVLLTHTDNPCCPCCHIPVNESWQMTPQNWEIFQTTLAEDVEHFVAEEMDEDAALWHRPSMPRQLSAREKAANEMYLEWEDSQDPFEFVVASPVVHRLGSVQAGVLNVQH